MRSTRLPTRQAGLLAVCLLAFISLVAGQTLPLVRNAAQQAGGPNPSGAATTPTPSAQPPAPPASAPTGHGRRDLMRYEKAGTFEVRAEMAGSERDALLAPARSFLLGRWRGRQLAQLVIQSPDVDGRPLFTNFYIEPDGSGRWCVVMETASGTTVYPFVKEVEVAEDGTPILNPTPEDAARRTGRRALHLKESSETNSGVVF